MREKRRFARAITHVPVKYRKIGQPGQMKKGHTVTRNISEGGTYFYTSEFISRACRLLLEFDMPMFTRPVKAISKVAWIKKGPGEEQYKIGNQFLEISKQDQKLISEYVNSLTHYNDNNSANGTED